MLKITTCAFVWFLWVSFAQAEVLTPFFRGELHLDKAGSPYEVSFPGLFVEQGNTLIIDPGVTLLFPQDAGLYPEEGEIIAGGEGDDEKIIMKSNGYWNGISGTGKVSLHSVVIQKAYSPILLWDSEAFLGNVMLNGKENYSHGNIGASFRNGKVEISGGIFSRLGTALELSNSSGKISEAVFHQNEAGLRIYGEEGPSVSRSVFLDNEVAIENIGEKAVLAENNFWGRPDGPFEGQLEGKIDFQPFLSSSPQAFSPCCSNVLFIPGFQGTRLYANAATNKTQLWEPGSNKDVALLFYDEAGKPINPYIQVGEIIGKTNIGFGLFNVSIYEGIINTLEGLVDSGTIAAWKPLPYDWRADLALPAGTAELIQDLALSSETGKVMIVAHSNGGLLAKKIVETLGEQKARRVIDSIAFVATPHIGAPAAVAGLLHGDEQDIGGGLIVKKRVARAFGLNLPGAYNLLPSAPLFESGDMMVSFAEEEKSAALLESFKEAYGPVVDTLEELFLFLTAEGDHRQPPQDDDISQPQVLKGGLAGNALFNNHGRFDYFDPGIPLFNIAAHGVPTIRLISYFSNKYNCGIVPKKLCSSPLELAHANLKDSGGDGTVPVESALFGKGVSYLFDLAAYNQSFGTNFTHAAIFEATLVQKLVAAFVQKKTLHSEYLSSEYNKEAYRTVYRFGTHSPVELHAYDAAGRHTGPASYSDPESDFEIIEEAVPNSDYEKIGEETYITLVEPQGRMRFKIVGTGSGYFDFDMVKTYHGGEERVMLMEEVPVSPGEVVEHEAVFHPEGEEPAAPFPEEDPAPTKKPLEAVRVSRVTARSSGITPTQAPAFISPMPEDPLCCPAFP